VPATDQDWSRAYAKQALSDLDAREKLTLAGAHKCHRLHFLQMAAEKICKAHLTKVNGHENIRKTHAYVKRNLPIIARQFYTRMNDENRMAQWEVHQIEQLAGEIELLAPACDDGAHGSIIANIPGRMDTGTCKSRVSTTFQTSMMKVGRSSA
jgi:hypothetical protein